MGAGQNKGHNNGWSTCSVAADKGNRLGLICDGGWEGEDDGGHGRAP